MAFVQNFPFFSIILSMASAVVCILLRQKAAKLLTLACLVVLTVMSAALLAFTLRTGLSFSYMLGHFPAPFGNELRAGHFEAFMALLFCSVTLLSVAGGLRDIYHDEPEKKINLFFFMMNILISAMLAVIYTNDIFTAYVVVEIITIAACSIISAKPGGRTLAASFYYLVLSLIGSSFMLASIAMLYGVTGHLLFPGIQQGVQAIVASGLYTVPTFVLVGFLITGLAIKGALFPFHGWLPDAHANATTTSSAILSGLIIKCYPILLIRMAYSVFGMETMGMLGLSNLLVFFGITGIVYGSLKALRQQNIKLMLAYGSISNMGFIFVAIGLNTDAGMAAAGFHIAAHAVAKAMLFTAAGGMIAICGYNKDFNSLRGAGRRDAFAGAAFVLGALSMIGIPLCAGFISKVVITAAALQTPFAAVVTPTVIIVSSVLSGMYYLPAIICIFRKPVNDAESPAGGAVLSGEEHVPQPLAFSYKTALIVFMAMAVFLGLFSQMVMDVIELGLAALGQPHYLQR